VQRWLGIITQRCCRVQVTACNAVHEPSVVCVLSTVAPSAACIYASATASLSIMRKCWVPCMHTCLRYCSIAMHAARALHRKSQAAIVAQPAANGYPFNAGWATTVARPCVLVSISRMKYNPTMKVICLDNPRCVACIMHGMVLFVLSTCMQHQICDEESSIFQILTWLLRR
jgi:hypothetical protein